VKSRLAALSNLFKCNREVRFNLLIINVHIFHVNNVKKNLEAYALGARLKNLIIVPRQLNNITPDYLMTAGDF